MGSPSQSSTTATLDLSRWSSLPRQLIAVGGVVLLLGLLANFKVALYAYLTAYMFCLSIGLGALFLVLLHHLFDAMWSVPIRRYCEHIACLLFPWMLYLFIPIGIFAPKIYPWFDPANADHALHAKHGYLNIAFWYVRAVLLFCAWGWLTRRLRFWSLQQDTATASTSWEGKLVFPENLLTGISRAMGNTTETDMRVLPSRMMRIHAGYGIFLFGITLSTAAIDWVKSLEHQWYSTMYGVYYFAGSVWTTLATVYLLAMVLKQAGPLKDVIGKRQFHDIGTLLFAFTVFYAYIHFSQYFLILNAAMPEETFWYIKREQGAWAQFGYLIIFGHFFVPFLSLLRIDAKCTWWWMTPICVWAWLMHLCDMMFNILPVAPGMAEGPSALAILLTAGAGALMIGLYAREFISSFQAHPPYPQRDPRMAEAMGVYVTPVSEAAKGGAK